MMSVMKRYVCSIAACVVLLGALPCLGEQKPKKENIQKPLAGPRASAVRFSRAVSNHPPRNSGALRATWTGREDAARVGLEVSREIAHRQGERTRATV